MKYLVEYYSAPDLNDIWSQPELTSHEHVTLESREELDQYVATKTDIWGNSYEVNPNYKNSQFVSAKFNYISKKGGVIIKTRA